MTDLQVFTNSIYGEILSEAGVNFFAFRSDKPIAHLGGTK